MIIARNRLQDPVSLEAFRSHVRVAGGAFDATLRMALEAAELWAEGYIGQAIIYSTITERVMPDDVLCLHFEPVEVTSVTVGETAVEPGSYDYAGRRQIALSDRPSQPVTVEYVAGMQQVPVDIQQAIMLRAADIFNNPEDAPRDRMTASEHLLNSHKVYD